MRWPVSQHCGVVPPARRMSDAEGMTSTDRAPASLWRAVRRAARCVADVVEECNYAQQRLHQIRFDPERSTLYGDRAPAHYGEFLFRCSGPPWREPSASERAAGAQVRSVAFGDAFKRQTRR
jgi:hypothetical protein